MKSRTGTRKLGRPVTRRPGRRLDRYASRMLHGARRKRPLNYLAFACQAIDEAIRLSRRLQPFLADQARRAEQDRWMERWEPILRKVYGPPDPAAPPPPPPFPPPIDIPQLRKDERALIRTHSLISHLTDKLAQNR